MPSRQSGSKNCKYARGQIVNKYLQHSPSSILAFSATVCVCVCVCDVFVTRNIRNMLAAKLPSRVNSRPMQSTVQ